MTEKKLTDCYWFLQGQCTKGETCEYRHCEATLDNPINCKFWMENKCTNPNCSFRHPSIPKKAATVCVFYVQGKCTKGDSCPFSHSIPLKQNEEEEIKKIQEERRKEEEKLAKLKQEAEKLQKQTQQLKESKVRKESPGAVSFVKTLNSIKNEQESKKKSPQEKKSNKQNNNNNKKVPKKQENQPSNQKGFGVKSLDEIIKDKGPAETVETKPTTQSAPSISKDGFDIQELRKKNLQKFGQSPVNNTSKDNNNATNSVSPKKRQSNEASKENPTAGDPKRRKTEETVTKPPTPTASAKPKVIEEDDFDKELAELAGTDVNTDGTGEADLDDELLNV